jgi:HTH-type transcriptional regulator/antitoxin HigA
MAGIKTSAARVDESYLDLIREFPLKPLGSEKELDRATAIIHRLIDRGFDDLTDGEEAYLEVLSDLVEKYESVHHPIEDVGEPVMLAHLIESRGVTQRMVAKATGIKESAISDLLAGRRRFNRDHIQKLAEYFQISPATFFPEARAKR